KKICSALEKNHKIDILNYGNNLHERLTGKLETSDMNTFSVGDSDRGCSIRIPRPVALKGYGYLEYRRPGANADPYVIAM
ncbi:glutamine synthetase, partial [Francisella tularensis subsp. holarctica]|nr:glutamine synthetase [Francisella tularensis subsp. holarctica]